MLSRPFIKKVVVCLLRVPEPSPARCAVPGVNRVPSVCSRRRFLYIVNLDTPSEAPRKIGRQSKWDVGTVQWNPHESGAYFFAASSNQRVDLYKWRDGAGEIHTSLQGHTRVISDLDWSWFDPELLVTSSVDTYIYIWDTRDTRKPTVALSAVGGPAQSCQGDCTGVTYTSKRIRVGELVQDTAVEYVAAHLSKIHGLDWHPDNEFILATSSQDNSVRFWDYRQPRKYLNILSCQVPVWKARYTPFSSGLVTVMVPQLRRENSLLLWSALDLNAPVHAFVGHDDVVLEFQWRRQKEGSKDYQLVTWSRDQTLRIWRVDPQLQRLCVNDITEGVEELMEGMTLLPESDKALHPQDSEPQHTSGHTTEDEEDQPDGLQSSVTPAGAGKQDQLGLPQTLQQEFSLVNLQIRNVNVEMDAVNRSCCVSAHCGSHQVRVVVKFPAQYPNNAAPSFQFVSPTTIPSSMKTRIQKILTDTSLQKVKRNQNCLEPCVRQLVSCLESCVTQEESSSGNHYVLSNSVNPTLPTFPRVTNTYGSYQDANIPFPRTSGARFCGAGCLVYFTRPITMHSSVSPTEPTPRSLSALSAYHSGVVTPMKMRSETQSALRLYSGSPTRSEKEQVSISSFYYKERKSRRWKGKREGTDTANRQIKLAGKVIIQEISCLLPVHKALGEMYIGAIALSPCLWFVRPLQVWALAAAATGCELSPNADPDAGTPWARHPFGRHLLETLLAHYSKMHDIQTLAMLCSVFEAQCSPQDYYTLFGHLPYRSFIFTPHHSRFPFSSGLVTVMVPQLRRENSLLLWSALDLNAPVHAFVGHDDVVLEFQWRRQKEGSKDYQLVTWSRDQTLRIWRVDPQLQRLCVNDITEGVEELMEGMTLLPESDKALHPQDSEPQHTSGHTTEDEEDQPDGLQSSVTPAGAGKQDQLGLPQTLQQEFSLVNLQIRNVNVEMDAVNRSCCVSAHCGSHQVRVVVKFPAQYPNNAAPSFQFVSPTTIPSSMKTRIQKILTDTSLQKVKRNQNCLEPCVRQLVSCLESCVTQEESSSGNHYVLSNSVNPTLPTFPRVTNTYGSYQDANIPFPRTSGARFCGAGCLVYFTRPITMHSSVSPTEPTPRSLSALSAYHSGVVTPMKMRSETQSALRLYSGSPTRSEKEQVSISSFYYKERKPPYSGSRRWSIQFILDCPKSRRWKGKREGTDTANRQIKLAGKVIIQEISCLLPVHKALGEMYILNVNDIQETCQRNAAAALVVGRRDLAKVWALAAAATGCELSPNADPDAGTPWARHPFGRHLLETLLAHYSKMHDIQTLAMLCSVFEAQCSPQDYYTLFGHLPYRSFIFTPHHSRFPSYTSSGSCSSTSDSGINIVGRDSEHTAPWGESSPDDFRYGNQGYTDPRERERDQHDKNKRLLDPANVLQFDDFKKCYGEILYRWGLREKRAEVLKFTSCPPEPHKGIEFGVYCCHCRSEVRGTQCAVCKRLTFQCAICHVAVRGSSNFCLSCGHGGHTSHMMEWFRTQEVCPTGCGCHCLLQSTF
ncbi:WDR59 protein, partial [Atractosteus spatula]|nr:WDR59 protein [Atractosteus spatula]